MEDESTRGVVYRINEDPFAVSVKFKQDIPLSKDIFELKEQEPKNYK